MLPDRVSNPGPLTYESGALPIALRGPAISPETINLFVKYKIRHDRYLTYYQALTCYEVYSRTLKTPHMKKIEILH